jgi:hypothetical protein
MYRTISTGTLIVITSDYGCRRPVVPSKWKGMLHCSMYALHLLVVAGCVGGGHTDVPWSRPNRKGRYIAPCTLYICRLLQAVLVAATQTSRGPVQTGRDATLLHVPFTSVDCCRLCLWRLHRCPVVPSKREGTVHCSHVPFTSVGCCRLCWWRLYRRPVVPSKREGTLHGLRAPFTCAGCCRLCWWRLYRRPVVPSKREGTLHGLRALLPLLSGLHPRPAASKVRHQVISK